MMLLSEGPMHAYQIEKEIENRSMRFWTEISMSSIYKLLKKLESVKLLISFQEPSDNGMVKNVFKLTETGLDALKSRMAEIISTPEHLTWRIDLATSHLDLLPCDQVKTLLKSYGDSLDESIEGYLKLEAYLKEDGCPVHALALARRPGYLLRAEKQWLSSYLTDLETAENG